MEMPYSTLLELQNQGNNSPYRTTVVDTVATHIRSFYRLFMIIIILLIISEIGLGVIIIAYTKSMSCPASRNMSLWLSICGVVYIIMCGFITIIVILRTTCCYQRFVCLNNLVYTSITLVPVILLMTRWMIIVADQETDGTSFFPTITQIKTKNCKKIIEYLVIITQIIFLSIAIPVHFFSIYLTCKDRCKKHIRSINNFTTTI
ncbi:unnamed protein product [Adineta steineri]|uniref:Uncharacterized protein n=1 Tax=Adineta steineri TaxID=433720 RepID=A0A819N3Y4_9BILA|nr:unnamed protein product [Adineta steineri]